MSMLRLNSQITYVWTRELNWAVFINLTVGLSYSIFDIYICMYKIACGVLWRVSKSLCKHVTNKHQHQNKLCLCTVLCLYDEFQTKIWPYFISVDCCYFFVVYSLGLCVYLHLHVSIVVSVEAIQFQLLCESSFCNLCTFY